MKQNDTKEETAHENEVERVGIGKGLEVEDTGGGLRYLVKRLTQDDQPEGSGPIMVLGVPGDAGGPETLNQPATVTLYFTAEHWDNGIRFEFDLTIQAIDFMAGKIARGLDKVVWQ
jgi:hypothetical protein